MDIAALGHIKRVNTLAQAVPAACADRSILHMPLPQTGQRKAF
jgi:hypothetical protein